MSRSALRLGRYWLQDQIGAGGMGEVWRGVDTVLERPVAVKLLRAEYARQAETVARFRCEARHASSFCHPAIALVHDYQDAGPSHPPYLVMELVDGPSLACLLLAGALDPARTMDVIAQTAAGLDAAHRAGLVHRDIKPANLLLDRHGRVKITDFGVADAVGSAPATGTAILGTPAYLAPERLAGAPAAPASDLYSLGIVAYECLAGRPPFAGTSKAVATAHRDSPLPPLPDTVPPDVAELVAELTAKDPAARPESAGEVAARAAHLRDGLPGGAVAAPVAGAVANSPTLTQIPLPDQPADRPRRWPTRGRHPASMLLALAAAAVLVAGVFGVLAGRMVTTQRSSPAAASALKLDVASLAGEPVGVVRSQLRQLGLVVRVVWERTRLEPARTVVSVQPAGPLHAGSVVTVTGALPARQLASPVGGQVGSGGSNDGGGGSGDGGGDGGNGSGVGGH
jgi:eukaryotic-like serine/threonine-protein kinase